MNGIQTSGRSYRNLSEPVHEIREIHDAAVPMRDGVTLLADLLLPEEGGRYPALVAFSPYPRQLQNSGLPLGFVEAGASDFFVPRGYAHVLANARGTCGSGGTYTWLDEQERTDLYDLIEWVAAQPWCDGRVGMIGISYFAMAQLHAAVMRPPHLAAIFPVATTVDVYRGAAFHGGMPSGRFVAAWIAGLGVMGGRPKEAFRGAVTSLATAVLKSELIHRRFEHLNGEQAIALLSKVMRIHYDPHPWDDLYLDAMVVHPLYDDFWRARDVRPRLPEIDIPVYLGCDWDNVPLHLPSTFFAWDALARLPSTRMTVLPRGGLCWPWESLHVEALAWFDHHLKGKDTGIMEGPPVRFWLEGAEEWRASATWPPESVRFVELYLRADGTLSTDQDSGGARDYLYFPGTYERPKNANPMPLPDHLTWETAPAAVAFDVAGPLSLELDAVVTGSDVDFIVTLEDVSPDGQAMALTQGWLRGSHRALDPALSRRGAPWHSHDRAEAIPAGEVVRYAIALVPTARRVLPGHRLRVRLCSSDHGGVAMLGFEHTPLGLASRQTVLSSSRLVLPLLDGALP